MLIRFAFTVLAVSLALSTLASASSVDPLEAKPRYYVIVNPKNSVNAVSREFIENVFLRKTTRWSNGRTIRPVDLASSSATRRAFSEDLLQRSIAAVRAYWQQRIFSGIDVPPPEFESDNEVIAYVLRHEDAVGYVSGSTNVAVAKRLMIK